jgi:DNA-binding CsgD family transcriptional regulator
MDAVQGMATETALVLRGRRNECRTLDGLLEAVRAGESRALVLRGEPGIGKTALLEYVRERASGCRMARAAGVQSELELAFAGLHQLCAPLLDRLDRLPAPQQEALGTAIGLTAGNPADRFLVGLAVLGLLSQAAEEKPLVCLVDDAQWLDRASAQGLAFVARRLAAESVGMVFAAREQSEELAGLPELKVEGLAASDARELLLSVVPGPLDERVCDQIVAETAGNPLALLELPRGSTVAELAGGFGLPGMLPLSGRIEESFRRRVEGLPDETRRLLLLAAAEPVGDPALLWRASARLGIGAAARAPAAPADLLEVGTRVRFRHPLVRSAVYQGASPEDRRSVHCALAEATDPEVDPDRLAWHRAHASPGPDEDVAQELERSAGRARARGGLAAAAAFLEHATALTPDGTRRCRRALAAATAAHEAGALDAALGLLAIAEAGPLDELERARLGLLRAQIAFALSHGSDAPPLLLRAARQLEPLDPELARETYLEAFSAALFVGRLAKGGGIREVAEAARVAPPPSNGPRAADLLLDGLALLITQGYPAGAPIVKRALIAFRSEPISAEEGLRSLRLACRMSADLWDYESWHVLSTRVVQLAREAGALSVLPLALSSRSGVHLYAGELAAAASLLEELETVSEATGSEPPLYAGLAVAALRGREPEVSALIEASMKDTLRRGGGGGLSLIHWASAVLCNGLGRYEDAMAEAEQASEAPDELLFANWGLVEYIEASTRSGKAGRASDALQRLAAMARASGTDWALGLEARSRAVLSEGEAAESLYCEAIERLDRTRVRVELARAHLVYGEWLRRERRRLDARVQLRTAHELLTAMGIEAFAERAARELLATGEHARKRTVETTGQLTAQEAQIARLARDGLSNPEIGGRLFISPRTVEYHLHKVFGKLAISSRRQLDLALPGEAGEAHLV